jgi:hypothetical protein
MSNWRFGCVCAEFEFDSVQCVTCTSFLPMCKLHFAGCQMKAKLSDLQTIRLCNSFVCGNTKLLYILSPCKHTKNLYQIMAENINIQEFTQNGHHSLVFPLCKIGISSTFSWRKFLLLNSNTGKVWCFYLGKMILINLAIRYASFDVFKFGWVDFRNINLT